MGEKGAKSNPEAEKTADMFVDSIEAIANITKKKMFGGFGIFCNGKMFGIVDAKGNCYLKTDEKTLPDFEKHNSAKHARMPYYAIPEDVFASKEALTSWANKAIAIAK